ncbi:MAG: diacylglycerol kinase [Gammaproteobacteria bacterium]|nr:MAG: diacylglycerol kinase [Gammaproteobacteria bacterium]
MEKNTGFKRIFYAGLYSFKGFKSALTNEVAFLQEFIAVIFFGGFSFLLDVSHYERLAMIISLVFVLIVEILNSAIECVVDRISDEHHILSGRAKDYGSSAVFLSILIVIAVWAVILLTH